VTDLEDFCERLIVDHRGDWQAAWQTFMRLYDQRQLEARRIGNTYERPVIEWELRRQASLSSDLH
jgi:hypothetical protein